MVLFSDGIYTPNCICEFIRTRNCEFIRRKKTFATKLF
jgi:hypothetical protein